MTTHTITAPHFFAPGTRVRVLQDDAHKEVRNRAGKVTRAAMPAHRWLCRGKSATDGATIVQWLAAGDLA